MRLGVNWSWAVPLRWSRDETQGQSTYQSLSPRLHSQDSKLIQIRMSIGCLKYWEGLGTHDMAHVWTSEGSL